MPDLLEQGHALVESFERRSGPRAAKILVWTLAAGAFSLAVWSVFHFLVFPVLRATIVVLNFAGGLHLSVPALSSVHIENLATYIAIFVLASLAAFYRTRIFLTNRMARKALVLVNQIKDKVHSSNRDAAETALLIDKLSKIVIYLSELRDYYENVISDNNLSHLMDDKKPKKPKELQEITQLRATEPSEPQ